MRSPKESYLKVFYDLRPAKQVERRMILDTFQRLAQGGFRIAEYQYTGFGSLYFVDFVMLHKYLGMSRLVNVEYSSTIKRRVLFNSPFGIIHHEFKPISEVIPRLSSDLKHILWLDYDDVIHQSIIEDVASAAVQLSVGSFLLITVDVEPPTESDNPKDWMAYYEDEVGHYLDFSLTNAKDFSRSKLPAINTAAISNVITSGLAGRPEVSFLPLFNFTYKDGHRMLTVGGLIGGTSEQQTLGACNFNDLTFIRRNLKNEAYDIRVPRLTRKERLYLDSFMPCAKGWKPHDFELSEEDVMSYKEIYRFYPAFAELFL